MVEGSAAKAEAPARQPRLYHLDALRASMMLMGVLVHGATLDYGDDWLFQGIRGASDLFRMACFFVVGGFFSAMLWSRSPWRSYFRSRLRQLMVPLAASLLLVVPVTNWLLWRWHEGPIGLWDFLLEGPPHPAAEAMISWHAHMWFLVVMCAYAALVPLLFWALRQSPVQALAGWLDRQPVPVRLWLLAVLMGLGQLAMRVVWHAVGLPVLANSVLEFPVKSALSFLPFFCLGMLAWQQAGVLAALERSSWVSIAVGCLLAGAAYWGLAVVADGGVSAGARAAQALSWLPRGMLTGFIIAGLMRLAMQLFKRPSPALRLGTDMALSFYIFHLPCIFAVALLVQPWLPSTRLVYLVVILVVPPMLAVFHVLVVERFAVMRLLWSGRIVQRRAPEPERPAMAK